MPLRRWDILLPFVIYIGQRRGLFEGILIVLFISHLFSLSSAAPIGVYVIHYLLIFFLARLLIYSVYATTWISILALIFLLALVSRFSLPLIASGFGVGWPIWSTRNLVFSSLVGNSVLGLFTYWLLSLLDRVTYKSAPINIELGEDQV